MAVRPPFGGLASSNLGGTVAFMNTEDEIKARNAVNEAIALIAQNPGTSGAQALARVLLHAHDHHTQPLDITDLCLLDEKSEAEAWMILKTRVSGIEPHELVSDKKAFEEIIRRYRQQPASAPEPGFWSMRP